MPETRPSCSTHHGDVELLRRRRVVVLESAAAGDVVVVTRRRHVLVTSTLVRLEQVFFVVGRRVAAEVVSTEVAGRRPLRRNAARGAGGENATPVSDQTGVQRPATMTASDGDDGDECDEAEEGDGEQQEA